MSDRGGARVVVDVPLFHLDRAFTYRVPERLRGSVWLGSRVKVPFGSRRRVDGWVVGWTDELPLLRWVADRYAGTLPDVLRLAVPPRVAAVERDTDPGGAPATAEAEPGGTSAAKAPAPSGAPDRLVEMVGRGWAGAAYWRPLPGEDRSARVIALIEAALARGGGAIVVTPERSEEHTS